MRALAALILITVTMVVSSPLYGESLPRGATALEAVTVSLVARNYATGKAGICQGSVYAVVGSAAYVVTAKHCVEALSSTRLLSGVEWKDIHEVVTVRFPNGQTGRVAGAFWPQNFDALVLKTAFSGHRPAAYVDVCPCGYYNYFPRSRRIPIISMLSAGGGIPVPSSGYLQTNLWGRYAVFLPDAQGTSGTLVVDMQGRMVGLVWGVSTPVEGGAGFTALITPAPVIIDLMKYAFDRDGVAYGRPQAEKRDPASAPAGGQSGGAPKGPWLLRRGSEVGAAILSRISALVQRAWGEQMAR
jgi:hypothetical protein